MMTSNGPRKRPACLVGVDSFAVTHTGTIEALRKGTIVAVANHTQVAAREHDALAWVRPNQLSDYPMPPADEPLVAWLLDLL